MCMGVYMCCVCVLCMCASTIDGTSDVALNIFSTIRQYQIVLAMTVGREPTIPKSSDKKRTIFHIKIPLNSTVT